MNSHGFKLIKEEYIKDIDSNSKIFEHEKSGARLLALENDDTNKAFGIGFRTPPTDSTGVAHILEHSVLNGSRKFKTKEPFMDLLKSSLQTFLNAMTFSDKTIYPLSSRNDKDFHNLMDVYLDAVFFPKVKTKKEIFLQEGWHYEIDSSKSDLSYKGVVYNEMKGAYSSPDTIMYHEFAKGLFPDSIYGNESGGNPYDIPKLTYENFIDFYDKYYHPVNSYIYLYGNMDLEENLKFINEEYLSNFEKIQIDSSIKLQPAFSKPKTITTNYSIAPDESSENKDILIYGVVSGEKPNLLDDYTNYVIREVLFSNDGSPLKLALLDKGIGEDVDDIYTDGLELGLGIVSINTSVEKLDDFEKTIDDELRKVVKTGIDKELLEATLNKIEFILKECDNSANKGVRYFISALDSWLYDESPTKEFKFEELLKTLRDKLKTDYFEKFVEDKIINNNHKVVISLKATPGLNTKKDKEIVKELSDYKKSLSAEGIDILVKENKELTEFQNKEDTKEEKSTIPVLKLSDIDNNVVTVPTIEEIKENYTVLYHPLFTGKINYVDFAFNLDFIKEEDVFYVSLLCDLISMVDTEKYSYRDIDTKTYLNTGGLNITASSIFDYRKDNNYFKKIIVSSKSTVNKTKEMFDLIEEVTLNSKFDNLKRIKEVLQIVKLKFESDILQSGHQYSLLKANSYFSQQGMYNEKLNGISYYDFIVGLENNLDSNFLELTKKLNTLSKKIFNINNLIINITTDEDEKDNLVNSSKNYLSKLSTEKLIENKLEFNLKKENEGIMTSSDVNYVIKTCNLKDKGFNYSGSYQVLSNILSNTYLYNNIRAKGGAYGTGMGISQAGNIQFYSYRDPNIENTLEIYDGTGEFLENLELSDDDLSQFIIGSLSKFDPPMTNPTKGKLALTMYISGQTTESLESHLKEAITTNLEDLKKFSSSIDYAMKENYMVTIGNSEQIKENKDLFIKTKPLKKQKM